MNLQPLEDRIVVRQAEAQEKTGEITHMAVKCHRAAAADHAGAKTYAQHTSADWNG